MISALAIILAQTCTSVLPKPNLEVEWMRNGRTWARDVPIEATALTRTYRRTLQGARTPVLRTLSCSNGTGGVVLTETINNDRQARLPLSLKTGESRRFDGVPVRRVRPPANAATNAFWFAVAADAARIYGVREGVGIVEMRTQSVSGGIDVFRAFLRAPAPNPVTISVSSPELQAEVLRLQMENSALQDSVAWLTEELRRTRGGVPDDATAPTRPAPDERIISFAGVDAFVARGRFAEAIDLLVKTRNQQNDYRASTGTEHPAAAQVNAKLNAVVQECMRANAATATRPANFAACAVRN